MFRMDLVSLLANHADVLLDTIAVAINKERAWLDALTPDEALLLAESVFQVNQDFFIKRARQPAMQQVLKRINQRWKGLAGPPSSSDSSAPDTPGPTLESTS